jgi:hypothetical protein
LPPLLIIIVFMKRNSVCASSFFCFSSGNGPHCMSLLPMASLKFAVFWWSQKLTSLRGTGASALPPLTIFHSPSALQPWPHCTQIRHRQQKCRRGRIPAQHRCASMTRPPALPLPNTNIALFMSPLLFGNYSLRGRGGLRERRRIVLHFYFALRARRMRVSDCHMLQQRHDGTFTPNKTCAPRCGTPSTSSAAATR